MSTSYQKTKAENLPIYDRWEIPADDRKKVIESAVQLCTERNSDNSLKRNSRTVIAAMRLLVSFDRLSLEYQKLRTPPAPRPAPQPRPQPQPQPPPLPHLPALTEDEEARAMDLASAIFAMRGDDPKTLAALGLTPSPRAARGLLPAASPDPAVASPSRPDRDMSTGRPKR